MAVSLGSNADLSLTFEASSFNVGSLLEQVSDNRNVTLVARDH